jgi:hypothetical protein
MDGLNEQLDASCRVTTLYCLAVVPSSNRVAAVDEKVLYYLAGLMLSARSSCIAAMDESSNTLRKLFTLYILS